MGSVMIKCPNTGLPAATGVETEPYVLRALPRLAARMNCPVCGQEHKWVTDEAWLAQERFPAPTENQDIPDSEAA